MEIEASEEIDLVSFSVKIPVEGMENILEVLLPRFNEAIDPTFIDPEVEYIGRITGVSQDNTGPKLSGYLDMCLSNLEVFSIASPRTDGLVMLRKGDEMIILTEHNAEVLQEEDMSEMMRAVEGRIAEALEEEQKSGSGGMFR